MIRESMVECAALVGQARALCSVGHGDKAVSLLDDALGLLAEAPDADREAAKERQRRKRERDRLEEEARHAVSRVTERDTVTRHGDTEGVEAEEEVGEEEAVVVVEEAATPSPARPNHAADVFAVYAHWRTHHPKAAPRLLAESLEYRRTVLALKAGHTVESLCKSIDGYQRSPFHNGANASGLKNQGLDLIFRDEAHITKGIEMNDDPLLAAGLSEKERRGVSAGQAWLADMAGRNASKEKPA